MLKAPSRAGTRPGTPETLAHSSLPRRSNASRHSRSARCHAESVGTALADAVETAVPLVLRAESEPATECFIRIIDPTRGGRLVTVMEFLSFSNKVPGEGQQQYRRAGPEATAAVERRTRKCRAADARRASALRGTAPCLERASACSRRCLRAAVGAMFPKVERVWNPRDGKVASS